ncbi:hypothetical protein [Actinomadura luteofluorescens]|uniref:hypothetical protein n=1 Tax=Actinomadura luteofluorescens TaxID=46163 RepID=UPI003D8A34A9
MTAEIDGGGETGALIERVAALITARIVTDTGHGQLGLEFAARAARDEKTRAVLAPMRRAQRDAAAPCSPSRPCCWPWGRWHSRRSGWSWRCPTTAPPTPPPPSARPTT